MNSHWHDKNVYRYQLRVEVSKRNSTKQRADLQEKRTALLRQIHHWREAQFVYTPYITNLIAASSSVDENGVQHAIVAESMLHAPFFAIRIPDTCSGNIQNETCLQHGAEASQGSGQ
jgi:hypothetical protein